MQTGETWRYEPVPAAASHLYRMCWQLESWLRTMVYVELRAARVDWEAPLMRVAKKWPPPSIAQDKGLYHMATPHQAALSYLTFGELWDVIADPSAWPLFAPYFPPRDNVDARIKEVKAIRNRVAHLREPHPQDVDRLRLFLRDMEAGIRRFCSRYTQGQTFQNDSDDEVAKALEPQWATRGYGIELWRSNGNWLYAPHPHRHDPRLHAILDFMAHPNYTRGKLEGVIYGVDFRPHGRRMNVVDFFNRTRSLHKDIIHIMICDDQERLRVTVPAVHGIEETKDLIFSILSAGLECSRGTAALAERAQLRLPEFVLWPDHLLTFHADEMREPILDTTPGA